MWHLSLNMEPAAMTYSTHQSHRKAGFLAITSLLIAFSVCSPAQAGEVKNVMKDMKVAMKGALNSSTMPEFTQYANRLQADAAKASKLKYNSDPETYHKGMQELQQELNVMNQAVRANDLKAAKAALQKVNASKKHYHDLLS